MVRSGHDLATTEVADGVRLQERRSWIHAGAAGFGVGASYRRPVLVEARGRQIRVRDHTATVRLTVAGVLVVTWLLRRFR